MTVAIFFICHRAASDITKRDSTPYGLIVSAHGRSTRLNPTSA